MCNFINKWISARKRERKRDEDPPPYEMAVGLLSSHKSDDFGNRNDFNDYNIDLEEGTDRQEGPSYRELEIDKWQQRQARVDSLRLFLVYCLCREYIFGFHHCGLSQLSSEIDKDHWKDLKEQLERLDAGDVGCTELIQTFVDEPAGYLGIHPDCARRMLRWSSTTYCSWPCKTELHAMRYNGHWRNVAHRYITDESFLIPILFAEPLPEGLDPRLQQSLLPHIREYREKDFVWLNSVDSFAVRTDVVPREETRQRTLHIYVHQGSNTHICL